MFVRKCVWALATTCLFFLFACGPKILPPEAKLDTPVSHVSNGNKLLWKGKINAAFYEFNRAKELDSRYAPAYIGLGLIEGYRGDFVKGLKTMHSARKCARNENQKSAVHLGFMRLYLMGRERVSPEWLKFVENEFSQAEHIDPNSPEPYFYMGMAYKMSYELDKAAVQFKEVLDINEKFVREADKEYTLLQKVKSAKPESLNGKRVALKEQITRADIAVLLIEELKIDELITGVGHKKIDPLSKSPQQNIKLPSPTDIHSIEFKDDIIAVSAYGIKGLQLFPDQTYKPDQMVTRAEYAVMLEDILIKVTGAKELANHFKNRPSPFPDLENDLPSFNAVMTCTTRGIMVVKDLTTGEFDPMGPVAGIEALLAIRTLQSQL